MLSHLLLFEIVLSSLNGHLIILFFSLSCLQRIKSIIEGNEQIIMDPT